MSDIQYRFGILMIRLKWFWPVRALRNLWVTGRLFYRLMLVGGHTFDESVGIVTRLRGYQEHVVSMKLRVAQREAMKAIAEASEITGIPQWELRGMIEDDTGIDL